MILFLMFAAGLIVGTIIAGIVSAMSSREESIGNLRIVNTGTEGSYMFLELFNDEERLEKESRVLLNVVKQDISHE